MMRCHSDQKIPNQYRRGVGTIVFNDRKEVFVAERVPPMTSGWQMPQGGIDKGESPLEAALRELKEEIGTNNVSLLMESNYWYSYDFPPDLKHLIYKGRYQGQIQKWFAFQFLGQDTEINIATKNPEFKDWKWLPMHCLPDYIVDFKKQLYQKLVFEFKHLATQSEF